MRAVRYVMYNDYMYVINHDARRSFDVMQYRSSILISYGIIAMLSVII